MREDPLRVGSQGQASNSCTILREKFRWRTHEKGIAEKCLNLEKHQDADGFSAKRH
jgi:hypothetical protein